MIVRNHWPVFKSTISPILLAKSLKIYDTKLAFMIKWPNLTHNSALNRHISKIATPNAFCARRNHNYFM